MELPIFDKFENEVKVGDVIIYTYCQNFMKGTIVRFTKKGAPVVSGYPSYTLNEQGHYRRIFIEKSLGSYKDFVKLNPTYVMEKKEINLFETQTR